MGRAAALPSPLVTVLQAAVGCFRKGSPQAAGGEHPRDRGVHGSDRQGDRDGEGTCARLSGGIRAAAEGDRRDLRRLLRGKARVLARHFVLKPDRTIAVSQYSSGPIGRLVW